MNIIMEWFGYVKCRECGWWTRESIIFGNICSTRCLKRERGEYDAEAHEACYPRF